MLYLPLSATDGRNMDRMHEAFNEFEVNQSAVLCAAYKLWQYHITPMGLTPEMLVRQFFEWCVNPETRDEAAAWLPKCKEEMMA